VAPANLRRQQRRVSRRGRGAEYRLLTESENVLRAVCSGPMQRAIRFRAVLDVDDVVQRGLQVAGRLLPLYASPARPPCSWLGMLRLDGRRDMHREVARLDGFPTEAVKALTLARIGGVNCHHDPEATLAALEAASARIGRGTPRITASTLDAALRAPTMLARAADAEAIVRGPESLKMERIQWHHGRQLVATVARLVSDDPAMIAAAVAGDAQALRRVGDGVVRGLRVPGEGRRSARHRCWEEFERRGQLFGGPVGRQRFGVVDPEALAALDERLRQAAGIRRVASGR
jgi:hypothetical protein